MLTGVIIGSGEKPQWWRVYWKGAQLISDHSGRTLKYVSAPTNIDLVEKTISMCSLMETNFVKDQAGLDKAFKKQQLNRNQGTSNIQTPSPAPVAHTAQVTAPAPAAQAPAPAPAPAPVAYTEEEPEHHPDADGEDQKTIATYVGLL